MRNSIRCCISCILPCGALDVIRIVHSNGHVQEITGSIKASDIMKSYPKHVLKKLSSSSSLDGGSGGGGGGVVPKIVVVQPETELQRGKIYFIIPLPSPPSVKNLRQRKKKKDQSKSNSNSNSERNNVCVDSSSDRYLSDILSEKKLSTQRDRRSGRVAMWRPHLESISESPFDL